MKWHCDDGYNIKHPYIEVICVGCGKPQEIDMRLLSTIKGIYCRLCGESLDLKKGF